MPIILLVVVGAINQSKYVPVMSLAVVETLTNQIFGSMWVYMGLCGGLHGSMWRSTRVYVGLCRSMQRSTWVYVGLRGGLRGSTWVYVGLRRAREYYPIKICASDVIGCGGNINQSDFVGLCGSTQVYAEVYAGLRGSMRVYMGVCAGLGNIIQSKSVPVMSLSVARSIKCPPLFVPGYHWLPLATIDIVGDNREIEV